MSWEFVSLAVVNGALVGLIIGLLLIRLVLVLERRSKRRDWERLIEKRERFVAAGCPEQPYDEHGRRPGPADPFLIDLHSYDAPPLAQFPDLHERDAIAQVQRGKIRTDRAANRRKEQA